VANWGKGGKKRAKTKTERGKRKRDWKGDKWLKTAVGGFLISPSCYRAFSKGKLKQHRGGGAI